MNTELFFKPFQSKWLKLGLFCLILLFPFLGFANEGGKIMGGFYQLIMIGIVLFVLFIIVPILFVVPKGKPRFFAFSVLNIAFMCWLFQSEIYHPHWGNNPYRFEVDGAGGILLIALALQMVYAWFTFRSKAHRIDEAILDHPMES